MGLRFFADHCVPNSVIRVLQNAGHQVFVLRENIPLDSSDAVVIVKAQELDAILLSLNGDFADITTYPPSEFKGIIALQVKNHPEVIPALMERLMKYISGHPELADYRGKLLVAEVHRIRIRR
jgi:predicted nuclease of predicted toxin-antitoxin system